ncbi:MAG TPA: EAL domain-containing protein [Methylophilaceae bacterium]|nr:EAL domain-containing protein [Methylophilaceae bacterium]
MDVIKTSVPAAQLAPNPVLSLKRFKVLADALERLSEAVSRHDIFEIIKTSAMQLVDAHGVTLVLREGEFCFYAKEASKLGALWQGQRFPLGSCISGWSMVNKETVVVENIFEDDRIPHEVYENTFARSLIMVPLGKDESFAAFGVYWAKPYRPTDEEVAVLETLARAAGAALEKQTAQNALIESKERFKALVFGMAQSVWETDPQGIFINESPRSSQFTDQKSHEWIGLGWLDAIHPEDRGYVREKWRSCLENPAPMRVEYRIHHADGSWSWTEARAAPLYNPDGSIKKWVGLNIDITEEKRIQEELLVTHNRLALAIEGSGDGIWELDVNSQVLTASRRLKEMFGYDDSEVPDEIPDWISLVHPDDQERVTASLQACLRGETPSYICEYRVQCKDGSWKWILTRGVIVERDAFQRPLRMSGTKTDISERKEADEQIWHYANFDPLTGLPNRRLFRDRLDHEVKKAHRNRQSLCLMFIDLDRFKEVNDSLGHNAGDQLLIQSALRIKGCIRDTDTVARLGGDEFTVILAELDHLNDIEIITQKILDALSKPYSLGRNKVYLSASIGLTIYPDDALTTEELIRKADQAMYAAKNAGKNQFSYFTKSMDQEAHTRMRLVNDLRHALVDGQLEVYFQPVVELKNRCIAKAEALIRWHHPELGEIEPCVFIPLAEESGLIDEIGGWVFKEAAVYSKKWRGLIGRNIQIGVNKSPIQFLSKKGDEDWRAYLAKHKLPTKSISVEITEGLLLHASDKVINRLLEYKDAGIQVALDDFGTGYSSMAYLKKFDIDYLKIDRSFITDITTETTNQTIAESMILMAHKLGLKVIAEGIETDEQEALLKEAGCDFGQGYFYSKALPVQEFEYLLMASPH